MLTGVYALQALGFFRGPEVGALSMFFQNWHGLVRVVVVGTLAYAAIIAILRVSGKRTLAKMNAFDLVVTVAIGSTLASVLLSKDVPLLEGILALALLAALQFAIAWASLRWRGVEQVAKSTPRLLLSDGVIDDVAAREERVTRGELLAAIRVAGFGGVEMVVGPRNRRYL